jgi:WD40 repeat protein
VSVPFMMFTRIASILLILGAFVSAQQPVSFHRDIRPILAKNCVGCHQPASRLSGLLLTSYKDLITGGSKGSPVISGRPEESLIVRYLTGEIKPQMPFNGNPLASDQIDVIRRWIAEGAKDDSPTETAAAGPARAKQAVYTAPPLVTAIAFSPDGRTLAVSGYHEILLHDFNAETGETKLAARLPGTSQRLHSIVFSPDGSKLAAVGGDPSTFGELQIWSVAERKQLHSVVTGNDTFFGASFSPDGSRIVFTGVDKSIRLFDATAGKEIRRIDHHEDWAFGAVFGVDGKRIVSVGRDRAAKLTEVETGRFIENVNLLREPLTAIARHPKKDWVLVGGAERVPYLYKMDRPRAMRIADDSTLIRKFEKQDGPILVVAISPDGERIAVGSETGDVRVYNLETGDQVAKCSGHQGGIYSLQFHPSGRRLAAAGFDGMVRVYDLQGTLVRAFSPVPIQPVQSAQR